MATSMSTVQKPSAVGNLPKVPSRSESLAASFKPGLRATVSTYNGQ